MALDKRFVLLSEVQSTPQRWLWRDRIPLGSLSVLEGDPGECKSAITYDLAARITRGDPMPHTGETCERSGVVLLQGEDTLGDIIRPRLAAAGADLARVVVYDKARTGNSPLLLPDGLGLVEEAVAAVDAKLLLIDPLTAFLAGPSTSEQALRRALGPLAAFAERAGIAVVLIRHLTKFLSPNPLYRGAGGIALVAAARSALLVASDPTGDDPRRRVLVQIKPHPPLAESLAFRMPRPSGSGNQARVEWLGVSATQARSLANAIAGGGHSRLNDATWVLYTILRNGPLPAREAERLLADAGIKQRTWERAREAMQVATRKGSGARAGWVWELPDDESLLRPAIERDRAERMRLVRREVAQRKPGDPWSAPAQDDELHRQALAERGLTVARIAGEDRLLRADDMARAALLAELVEAVREGEAGAEAPLRDLLGELGIDPEQVADWNA